MRLCAAPVTAEPLPAITADDVLALTLSLIRGRIFGSRSAEVKLLRLSDLWLILGTKAA